MSTTLKSVVNNTAPAYDITCDRDDGSIIPLAGMTVTLKLYTVDGGTATDDSTVDAGAQTNITSGHDACTIVDQNKGIISWQPKTGDLPVSGKYVGDVIVTDGSGHEETLYGQFKLKVRDKGIS